jgi:hypothetical protein
MLDKNKTGYYNFEKYKVNDVKTIEEFLQKYTKYSRHQGRGQEYVDCRIKSHKDDLVKYGYTFITHHDSVTGEVVSFYGEE